MEMILDALFDAVLDTAKLIPFLLITYMGMEYLEHKAEKHTTGMLEKAGHFGPLIGAAVGILPQCGFSAAASSLFAGGVISVGTLIAVFLSTSDEMLPIFISEGVHPATMLRVLATKAATMMKRKSFIQRRRIRTRPMQTTTHIVMSQRSTTATSMQLPTPMQDIIITIIRRASWASPCRHSIIRFRSPASSSSSP